MGGIHTLYVGAPLATVQGLVRGGGVYKATWPGTNTSNFVMTALSTPIRVQSGDGYGRALSVRGGHPLAGAPYADQPFQEARDVRGPLEFIDAGTVYLLTGGDPQYAQQIVPAAPKMCAQFASSVTMGSLINGAPVEFLVGASGSMRRTMDLEFSAGSLHVLDPFVLFGDGFETNSQ